MLELLTSTFLSIPLIGAFALFTLGIVVIYRASRVLNLAHGAMAMAPAYLNYSLVQAGLPTLVALPLAVTAGVLLGVAVERVFVRRLRPQGPTAQTVGTVAVTGLIIALVAKIYGTTPILAPSVFPAGELTVADTAIRYGELGLLVVGLTVAGITFAFFRFTEYGLAMRGAAVNREAAALMGVDPDKAAAAAWGLGGGLAALAGVLLASVTNLEPFTLSLQVLPAFVAALVGGLESLVGAIVGAIVVGLTFGLVPVLARIPVLDTVLVQSGAPQLVLTVLALVVMAIRGRRVVGVEASEAGMAGTGSLRRGTGELTTPAILGIAGAAVFPLLMPYSWVGGALVAVEFAIIAISLVVLTGWVGQISLAQGTFVGIGAFITALFTVRSGLGFPVNVLVGAAVAGVVAVALGAVALRVRGLYLAVATLIFAWMGETFLFRSSYLGAQGGSTTIPNQFIGEPGAIPAFDLTSRTTLYYLLLAFLVLVVAAMANVRDTRTGRAFFAVRGSEMAASSLGIDITRVKLVAFGISGVLAGLGGSLIMLELRTVSSEQFFVTASLQFLAIAVVGGLTSLGGAVAAGVLFASLDVLFFTYPFFSGLLPLVSSGLLALVLLTAPGGLAAIPEKFRKIKRRMQTTPAGRSRLAYAFAGATSGGARARADADSEEDAEAEASGTLVKLDLRSAGGSSDGDTADHDEDAEHAEPGVASRLAEGVAAKVRSAGSAVAGTFGRLLRPVQRAVDRRQTQRQVPQRPDDWFAETTRTVARMRSGEADGGESDEDRPADGEDDTDDRADAERDTDDGAPRERRDLGGLELAVAAAANRPPLPEDRSERRPLIEADDITVRFGGLTAVDDATLHVNEGEIVGLIGPNGAGKTTLFNAILGLNDPAAGSVKLYGRDVGHLAPHLRARMGVARTFQVLQLFEQLTVFDNLLVATHLHNDAGLLSNLVASPLTVTAEARARRRVAQVLELLDLGDVAHESVRNLPFGVLRMVELGRALVTGAKVLMLDEAASGLNDAETERLVEVVRRVRDLGVSVLLIEHDVPMVCGVSDFVYVLDQGRIIAADTPAAVQRDPDVIAAYIGGAAEDEPTDPDASAPDQRADDQQPAGVVS